MKIQYNGSDQRIKVAVEDANDVLNEQLFYNEIASKTPFECTKLNPKEISSIIQKSSLKVNLKFYKSRWPFSTVNGYFVKSTPNVIYLNIRRLNRSTPSLSNTIVHEYIHSIDNEYNDQIIDFGHTCKNLSKTAPYIIGGIAEAIINGEAKNFNNNSLIEFEIEENRIINF
jgi:hypothetical protein